MTGGGNPAALHVSVTFCFSLTVMEEEGFAMKCGNSEKKNVVGTLGSDNHLPNNK